MHICDLGTKCFSKSAQRMYAKYAQMVYECAAREKSELNMFKKCAKKVHRILTILSHFLDPYDHNISIILLSRNETLDC